MASRRLRVLAQSILLLLGGSPLLPVAAQPPGRAPFRLEETTIADVHAAFAAGTLTCRQLVGLYLDRVRAYDDSGPKLNTLMTVNPRALEEAAALDERHRTGPAGPLHCIPVVLKDNINTVDMPTSSGSAILRDTPALDDATIVKALRNAGALILGKAAMGELAAGSYSTAGGQQRNPYNPQRDTGGSSSGAAAAVAANLATIAVGTDTYTSVRGPATDTGIVGLRPTTGLISRNGVAPRKPHIDTAGPLARTVTDAAILLNVLAGPDRTDPLSLEVYSHYPERSKTGGGYADFTQFLKADSLRGARVGIVRDFFGGDPEVDALAEAALLKMQALGAQLVEVRLDPQLRDPYVRDWIRNLDEILVYPFREWWETYLTTLKPGAAKTVAEWVEIYETELARSPLPPATGGFSALTMMKGSLTHTADDPVYRNMIENILPKITEMKLAIYSEHAVDVLVFPFRSTFAPPISNPIETVRDPKYVSAPGVPNPAVLGGYGSVGFPMIVVPMGFGSQGLPTAITFMGRPYEDGKILGYAFAYEQASRLRRPSPLLPPL